MNRIAYIGANVVIMISIAFSPWLADLVKYYMIGMLVIITLTINVAFRFKWLMDIIIEHLVQAVLQKVLRDTDIQKVMHWKFEEMRKKSRKKLRVKSNE